MNILKLSISTIVLFFFVFISIAQPLDINRSGVKWTVGLTWEQVKQKAIIQNKYIFVDCFATWCAPCKQMDQKVYSNDTVGDFMNNHFVSVRVQIDTTKKDNEEVMSWYKIASLLKNEYSVSVMPTYLFFSPEGKIVHKSVGFLNISQFVLLSKNALDSNKQYYFLLSKYISGKIGYDQMPGLAKTANRLMDEKYCYDIALRYMHEYLDKVDENSFCTKDNQSFITQFRRIVTSSDRVFEVCLKKPKKMDSLIYSGYSEGLVDYVIAKEEILMPVEAAKKQGKIPDWQNIMSIIKQKYGIEYAKRNVLFAKTSFYRSRKDWKNYTKHLTKSVEEFGMKRVSGLAGAIYLNDQAWDIFLYSDKKEELKRAVAWCDLSLKLRNPSDSVSVANAMDTKANLLYKDGRIKEALELEEKAILTNPRNSDIQQALANMKKGIPTW